MLKSVLSHEDVLKLVNSTLPI